MGNRTLDCAPRINVDVCLIDVVTLIISLLCYVHVVPLAILQQKRRHVLKLHISVLKW